MLNTFPSDWDKKSFFQEQPAAVVTPQPSVLTLAPSSNHVQTIYTVKDSPAVYTAIKDSPTVFTIKEPINQQTVFSIKVHFLQYLNTQNNDNDIAKQGSNHQL